MQLLQSNSQPNRHKTASVPISIFVLSTFFQRPGIWLAGFPFPLVLILAPCILGIGFLRRRLTLCPKRLLLFVFFAGSVIISSAWGTHTTPMAALLFLLIYSLWTLCCPVTEREYYSYFRRVAFYVSLICVLGVLQYFSQFVTNLDFIFSWRGLVPDTFLIEHNALNELSYNSGHYKSNGLFLLEASSLSGLAARELLLVVLLLKDTRYIFPLVLGLAFALSGTGLVFTLLFTAIPLAFLLVSKALSDNKPNAHFRILLGLAAIIAFGMIFTFYADYFLGRLDEFSDPRTSGYARYTSALMIFNEHVMRSPGSFFLGHGPGSFDALTSNLTVAHPTGWIKLFVELGLLGVISFSAFFMICVRTCTKSWYIAVAMLFHYLLLDSPLLSPQYTFLAFSMFVLPVVAASKGAEAPSWRGAGTGLRPAISG